LASAAGRTAPGAGDRQLRRAASSAELGNL